MRKDFQEYYRVLNLRPGATPADIKRSYHQIIRRWHPDLFKPGSLMQKTAEDITKETNEAFEQLFKKKHYRKFPAPGETPPSRRRRAADKAEAPKPRGRSVPRNPLRFPRWPWRKIAIGAFAVGASVAGFALRAEIRAVFSPKKAAATVVASTAAAPRESPTGLAAVSVTMAEGSGTPSATVPWVSRSVPRSPSGQSEPSVILSRAKDPVGLEQQDPSGSFASLRMTDSAQGMTMRGDSSEVGTGGPPVQANPGDVHEPGRAGRPSLPVSGLSEPFVILGEGGLPTTDLGAILDETAARLRTFKVGDSKARVLEIQGVPNEDRRNVLRYGSSLVYFKNGWVTGWIDRVPRLNIRRLPTFNPTSLDTFALGSNRSDVIRAQGLPTSFTSYSYSYGTSFVFFDNDQVSEFGEGDLRLSSLALPTLPHLDLDQLP